MATLASFWRKVNRAWACFEHRLALRMSGWRVQTRVVGVVRPGRVGGKCLSPHFACSGGNGSKLGGESSGSSDESEIGDDEGEEVLKM